MIKKIYADKVRLFDILVTGLLFIGLGIFILNTKTFIFLAFSFIVGIIFVLDGVLKGLQLILQKIKKEDALKISDVLVNIGIGIFILSIRKMTSSFFIWIFMLYTFLLGSCRGVNYIILKNNNVKGRWIDFISCVFYICFSLFLIKTPQIRQPLVMNLIGTYFILYGLARLKEFILYILPAKTKNNFKRHIRMSLPVLFLAIVPKVVLDKVNSFLSTFDEEDEPVSLNEIKSDEKADIEVYIHVSDSGFGQMGHVDLCIGDEFFSYGNYDYNSVRLNETLGDGVLIKSYKDEYIPFVIKDSNKTLFCFGLKLNEESKKRVYKQLKTLKNDLIEWNPPEYTGDTNIDMYASRLKHNVNKTKFYKFKRSKFKTYFVVTTNCVQLADYVLGSMGLDILNMNGIITPGAYYDYLNRQFQLNNKMIIYRKIYK